MLKNVVLSIEPARVESCVLSLTTHSPIGDDLRDRGISVAALGGRHGWLSMGQVRSLRKSVAGWRPDIVHGWMYHANLASRFAVWGARGRRPALITSVRGALNAPERQKLALRTIRRVDALLSDKSDSIIFNSAVSAAQHVAMGYASRRIVVIPNGFDLRQFCPSEASRQRIRTSLGLGDGLLVGLVGRFNALKGHREFLEAARLVAARVPDVRFILVGKGCDSENPSLRQWIRNGGLENLVVLLGERRDVPAIDAALDVVVSASVSESFPNSVGEAMACGVPAVVTDVGDCRELVGDGGLVVPPRNPSALADAIVALAERGTAWRRQMGERGRRRVASLYALPAIADRYAMLYEEIAGRRDSKRS